MNWRFEKKWGQIKKGSFVAFNTGWSRFWDEPKRYKNNYVFPTLTSSAANLLCEREIVGIGVDTLSPDSPESGFPVHSILLGFGCYIVENMANLNHTTPVGGTIAILPFKGKEMTEAPVRAVWFSEKI